MSSLPNPAVVTTADTYDITGLSRGKTYALHLTGSWDAAMVDLQYLDPASNAWETLTTFTTTGNAPGPTGFVHVAGGPTARLNVTISGPVAMNVQFYPVDPLAPTGTVNFPAPNIFTIQGNPLAAPVPISVPAGGALTVQGSGYVSVVDITRPANVTPYTAGDVVGGVLALTNIGPSGGVVLLNGADLRYDVAAVPAGMTSYRLHVYSITPPSALADNAVWDLPAGDRGSYRGYVDVGTPVDVGSTLFCQSDQIAKQFDLPTGQTQLFGYLITNSGFTPAAVSETLRLKVRTAAL